MNRFTVDFSSSPASDHLPSNSPQRQGRNVFSVPEDVASTTPAAPPPSQLFGGSQFGTGVGKLQFAKNTDSFPSSAPRIQSSQRSANPTPGQSGRNRFQSSTYSEAMDDEEPEYSDEMMDEYEEYDEEPTRDFQRLGNTAPSLMKFSTNSIQQSLGRSIRRKSVGVSRSRLPRKGRSDIMPGLARNLSRQLGVAKLTEPEEIILETEKLMREFDQECQRCDDAPLMQAIINDAAQDLISQWKRRSRFRSPAIGQNVIGPDSKASYFEKAQYLATLLLTLRHPPIANVGPGSLMYPENDKSGGKPIPEVLLEWLDHYHINYGPLYNQVMNTTPAPSANELYWDAIETFTLRGKFEEVMELLRRGDLNYAVVDTPNGSRSANYSGTQLQQAEDAVYRARQLINTCPAFQDGDWALDGQDWDVYRKQLEAEIDHLAEQVVSQEDSPPQQSNKPGLFAKPLPRSGLPFNIFQRLKTVYSIMLCDANEIIGLAQDWVEATILTTVWWVPTDERGVTQWSFDVSRANDPKIVDEITPYLTRLSDSFLCATDPGSDSGFQLNTMDAVEVGLGPVLQGDIQSCLRILQSLSLCAASSVAEIGTWAGWLTSGSSSAGLDQDDLMVLNYGTNDTPVTKDDILETYAREIFDLDVLHSENEGAADSWELSFSLLGRMDDRDRMHSGVVEMLQSLSATDQQRTARLVEICEELGFEEEGRKVSEAFADNLVNNTSDYGTALLCYARAHAEHKVQQVIDLLNSYCLVQSKAYPSEQEMDPALMQLVSSPKSALQSIADADREAADTLQFYLVGYACLRRFYSLRDDQTAKGTSLQPLAKKKAAAKALIAAINSAADAIYGGLYDANRRSAIQVDGLLTLLGEATVLVSEQGGRRVMSVEQLYALLAAVEDLQTVSDRVYHATQECMEAALRNYHGSLPPSPHAMLKKSVSSGTNSNFSFSMMGSEMLARSDESFGDKSLGSAVMIGKSAHEETRRGWDWRASFKDRGVTGADVLRHLRICIANELSIATVEDGDVSV